MLYRYNTAPLTESESPIIKLLLPHRPLKIMISLNKDAEGEYSVLSEFSKSVVKHSEHRMSRWKKQLLVPKDS